MEAREIPPILRARLQRAYGESGRRWLEGVPALLDRFRHQWDIAETGDCFPYVGHAWVAPCVLGDGTAAVLKLAPPEPEVGNEIAALKLYGGCGAVQLLASDEGATALLIERLEPGTTLAELDDDVTATAIAARAFAELFRPLPADHPFPGMARWGQAFGRVREKHGGGCGSFPRWLFEAGERVFSELAASQAEPVLLHGDLHHHNILRTRAGWLAIDPKGLAGEPAAEVGPFLYNNVEGVADLREQTLRRIGQFSEVLGIDRARLTAWGFALAVLSAVWTFETDGSLAETPLAVAEALVGEV